MFSRGPWTNRGAYRDHRVTAAIGLSKSVEREYELSILAYYRVNRNQQQQVVQNQRRRLGASSEITFGAIF